MDEMNLLKRLWDDEAGFIVSIELILIASIAVLGLIVGLSAVRDAVISELSDVAGAIQDLNQSYVIFGVNGHSASTGGSDYHDELDFCDSANDVPDDIDNCIVIADNGDNDECDPVAAPTGP